jgi:hypothetical protein
MAATSNSRATVLKIVFCCGLRCGGVPQCTTPGPPPLGGRERRGINISNGLYNVAWTTKGNYFGFFFLPK